MISISPWFERVFHFGLEPEYSPLVLERLIGTRPRLDALLAGASTDSLLDRPGGAWSVQQHVGHLADLEPLWYGRVDDILSGVPEMRPADLLNRATDAADHNDRPLEEVLRSFTELRGRFTERLAGLDLRDVARASDHPRLKQPMRIIDLAVFVAEHDDHHLATIRQRVIVS
jgi:uncharacterized damage-inducible protein DinB